MFLESIELVNFRSYKNLSISFKPQVGLNIFIAPNGQGKTNLLEAISLLSFPKSFRNLKFDDICNFDSYYFSIKGNICPSNTQNQILDVFEQNAIKNLHMVFDKKQKEKAFFIDEIKLPSKEFMGNFQSVVFTPDDMHLFVLGPVARRKFLNTFLSSLFKDYFESLITYNKNLKIRNKMLKDGVTNQTLYSVYNQKLAQSAAIIYSYRSELIDYLNQNLEKTYNSIAGTTLENQIKVKFTCFKPENISTYKSQFIESLNQNFEKDLRYKSTNLGIHRDDFQFLLDGKAIIDFCSRGENRTFILALKFLQVDYLKQFISYQPILLLDDVFSELDSQRRKQLLSFASNYQTFITTVENAYFDDYKGQYQTFKIQNAEILAID